MARPKPDAKKVAVAIREFALDMPGAWEDTPWEEDQVAKVGKKIFVFMGHLSDPTPKRLREAARVERASTRPRLRDAERATASGARAGWYRARGA